jgi:hypothetical protein
VDHISSSNTHTSSFSHQKFMVLSTRKPALGACRQLRPRTRISNQTIATPVVKFRTGTSATASPPIVMGSPFAPCCDLERRPTCKSLLPDFFTVPQNVVHKRFHPRCFGAMLSDLDTSSTAQWTPSPVQFMCSLCLRAIQNEEIWMCHINMQVGNGVQYPCDFY